MIITYDYLAKYGQLGNQMFEYALLVGVKYKTNATIVIDNEVKKISYLFDFFDFKECEIDNIQINNLYNEKYYHFDPEVFTINQDTNFRGYFQSEKYFKHCENIIRNEFKFKPELIEQVDKFLEPYKGMRLVSVHVRRGDYLANPDAHPLCTLEYYNETMNRLDGENIFFICTSDDKEWCEQNLKRKNIVFNNQSLINDMCLISRCNDHIISNSTFSWWGSWLGQDENKKIYAPKIWFGSRYSQWDLSDMYCNNWIKI